MRVGVGAADHLAVSDRVGDDAGARLDDGLLGERAFGRAEPLALAEEVQVRLGQRHERLGAQYLVGREQQRELVFERDRERVDGARRLPDAARGLERGELDAGAGDQRARACDGHRLPSNPDGLLGSDLAGGREAPGAVGDGADADAEAVGALNGLDDAGGDLYRLAGGVDDAHVGIGRAGERRRVERGGDDVVHGSSSEWSCVSMPHGRAIA